MATRTLLCVEPDEGAVAEIRSALAPYGFKVESIPNGEQAIEWARKNGPEIIMVCVEPRKVGYAICNKLKRTPELQKIPLVLTSAEETQQTFEQHKKLKSRADEYILKPLRRDDLLKKLGGLVQLGEPQLPSDGEHVDIDEEIAIADSDLFEDEAGAHAASSSNGEAGRSAGSPFGGAGSDDGFDQETDAAFAAIQSRDTTGQVLTSALPLDPEPTPIDPRKDPAPGPNWDEEAERTRAMFQLPEVIEAELAAAKSAGTPTPPPVVAAAVESAPDAAGPDIAVFAGDAELPSPEEVNAAPAVSEAAESRVGDLLGRIAGLEEGRSKLLDEIEDLKLRLQSQPLSKEKEVLALREMINRKEKDILDLRDALDAKDRQILDQKDRVREHERSRRDLEEKMLALEKGLMGAQERTTALAHDKEKSVEREKGLKARLDNALTEIQKAHSEVEALKKRAAQVEDRARSEQDRMRGEHEARVVALETGHRQEVERLSEERVQADEEWKTRHDSELSRLKNAHAAEMEAQQKRATDEQNALNERLEGEIARLRREHEKALVAAKDEQAVQLAAERQAHQAAIENKERDHKNEILEMRGGHEDELRVAEERRQRELGEAETRKVGELEAAEARRRQELQALQEEHHAQLAEMDRRHFNEKTEAGERHRQEMDQAHARAARAEGELAGRTEELSEKQRRLGSLESDLETLRADLREREVKLGQARDRIAELEGKAADYEDQILRSFQKLRTDDKLIDRAKRALAVALSLLDERGAAVTASSPTTAAAPSTATGTAAAQPGPAPARGERQGEESAT